MYDFGVALRRNRKLIGFLARKYAVRGHYSLSRDDLEAEGLLCLVTCCREFPQTEVRFSRYFKRSLANRFQNLFRLNRQHKRQGVEVRLESVKTLPVRIAPNIWIQQALNIEPFLAEPAKKFLSAVLHPPAEVYEFAWRDFCRRNKLHSQGLQVSGWRTFRIRPRHIRGGLRMSAADVRLLVREIRDVYRKHTSKCGG